MLIENIESGNINNMYSSNGNIITPRQKKKKKKKKGIMIYNDWLARSNAINHLQPV